MAANATALSERYDRLLAGLGPGCALHRACFNGRRAEVLRLLREGRCVDGRIPRNFQEEGWRGATPLYLAILTDRCAIVRDLLDAGADVSQGANDGITPAILTVAQNRFNCLRELIATGADVDAKPGGHGKPWLFIASHHDSVSCVRLLVAAGADVHGAADKDGWTPLHIAAAKKSVASLRILLASGRADVSTRASDGVTPLHAAAIGGSVGCLRLLLAAGGAGGAAG